MTQRLIKIISLFLCFCLILEQGVFAQTIDLSHYFARNPAQTIPQSDKFRPLHLRYISKALHLKPAERFVVIEALIRSLDNPDPAIEKAWAVEAERRLKAYKSGKVRTVSFEEMFEKRPGL